MNTAIAEFDPLDLERAMELEEIINQAGARHEAVVIDPDERGVTSAVPAELISPAEDTNGLARYQRHY